MGKSSYPGQIDSDVELPRVDNNITEIGGSAINSLRDAVFAIENTLGIDPQGNTASVVARINVSIDENGEIKQSALAKRGLVTLPITNLQVGFNAAIEETKLDLDYGTSLLHGLIEQNASDLEDFRESFNILATQTTKHFSGIDFRHDGYHIDLVNPIRSSENMETAINVINNDFTNHENSIAGAHNAYGIEVNDEFINFSADNTQDALVELDRLGTLIGERHQDEFHKTGVGLNRRGEQGLQGNLKETVLAGTIFQTETAKATHIFQVMRPNVARVTSKNIELKGLDSENSVLRIQAGGIDRGPLDVNLTAIIPNRTSPLLYRPLTIDDVVNAINTKAQGCVDHYPISAYNTGGKLTVAHIMAGDEFTIQILDDVQFSAASVLGFGDVTGTVFRWAGNSHSANVGGVRVNDLKPLIKTRFTHNTKPLNTLPLGLGDLAEKGLIVGDEGRVLVNITNHSTFPEDNGTHYILGYPNDETIVLSADIQNGTFDLEIVSDSVNFQNSANGEIFDIFVEADVDGYGVVTKSRRVSYGPISGVSLKSISETFPTANVEWQVTDGNQIQLFENNIGGTPVSIPTSFLGQLQVYASDNFSSAIFEFHEETLGSNKKTMDISASERTDDRLHVASVHHAGNFGSTFTGANPQLRFAADHRQLGASQDNKSENRLNPIPLEKSIKELRNNGVIRGFDIISSDDLTFKIRGGTALVDGRLVEVETKDVVIDNVGAASRLLLLDKHGNYFIRSEFDPGFTFAELTAGDAYGDDLGFAIIAEFETNGTGIDGYFTDRRLFVNKLDKKLIDVEQGLNSRMTQLEDAVGGSLWGFTEAVASGAFPDGYLASIERGNNNGFTYIDSGITGDDSTLAARGFTGGLNPFILNRRFEFSDPDTIKTSVFKSVGMSHINVFVEAIYTGTNGGPFGVSGTVTVELGVAVETGITNVQVAEDYATVKTIFAGVLPSASVTERYVASIPTSQLNLPDNVLFDFVPRVRILNSTFANGGGSSDSSPTIRFNHIRVVTSSYSIAGNILEQDGTSSSLAAGVGAVL